MAGKVTVGQAQSNGSLPTGLWLCMGGLLCAWLEVVLAHHWAHDYACCHLQADCWVRDQLGPPQHSTYEYETAFTFTFTF